MKTTDSADETKAGVDAGPRGGRVVTEHNFDSVAFDAAAAKWFGSARERMLELGFGSTDEFMKAIRGR